MSKKPAVIVMILSILAIGLSVLAIGMSSYFLITKTGSASKDPSEESDIQYVLYLGTNDKDTNEPVYTPDEAEEKAKEILIEHFGGYTIQEANGGWVDGDNVYQEYTLVITLSDTNLDQVHAASDDLIREFNQSTVLIQANETMTEFYAGSNA